MSPTEPRVLLGEPDTATAELYQRALRPAFDVLAATNEQALHDLLRTHEFAVLVLEPALFAIHTWDDTQTIGRACAARGIPFIICSTLDERRRGIEYGAAAYLLKPTLPTQLVNAVWQVINHLEK